MKSLISRLQEAARSAQASSPHTLLLLLTLPVALLVLALDALGFWHDLSVSIVSGVTLFLLAQAVAYVVLAQPNKEDLLRAEAVLNDLKSGLAVRSLTPLPTYIAVFERVELEIRSAKSRVYDLTWGPPLPRQAAEEMSLERYRTAVIDACTRTRDTDFHYHEVITFDSEARIRLASEILAADLPNYQLRYYDTEPGVTPPLLQFMVIDDTKVILFEQEQQNRPTAVLIESPLVAGFFAQFFERIWDGCGSQGWKDEDGNNGILIEGKNRYREKLDRLTSEQMLLSTRKHFRVAPTNQFMMEAATRLVESAGRAAKIRGTSFWFYAEGRAPHSAHNYLKSVGDKLASDPEAQYRRAVATLTKAEWDLLKNEVGMFVDKRGAHQQLYSKNPLMLDCLFVSDNEQKKAALLAFPEREAGQDAWAIIIRDQQTVHRLEEWFENTIWNPGDERRTTAVQITSQTNLNLVWQELTEATR